jgi:hypothetical protein
VNAAREKVELESECRACGYGDPDHLDAAHVWDRSLGGPGFDYPDAIVPLCSRVKGAPLGCHEDYDDHRLDLWPLMRPEERAAAARFAGSVDRARDRASGAGLAERRREGFGPLG